jgi:hypothetical protein
VAALQGVLPLVPSPNGLRPSWLLLLAYWGLLLLLHRQGQSPTVLSCCCAASADITCSIREHVIVNNSPTAALGALGNSTKQKTSAKRSTAAHANTADRL